MIFFMDGLLLVDGFASGHHGADQIFSVQPTADRHARHMHNHEQQGEVGKKFMRLFQRHFGAGAE